MRFGARVPSLQMEAGYSFCDRPASLTHTTNIILLTEWYWGPIMSRHSR